METSSRFNSAPWRIAGIYALISACWILFSDKFVEATTSSIEALTRFAVLKGWAFVLATSALIFYLMRREMARFLKVAASQRASEANFRLLVENAPDAVFVQTKSQFAY